MQTSSVRALFLQLVGGVRSWPSTTSGPISNSGSLRPASSSSTSTLPTGNPGGGAWPDAGSRSDAAWFEEFASSVTAFGVWSGAVRVSTEPPLGDVVQSVLVALERDDEEWESDR